MNELNKIAVLFDFDGVVMDTEGQYTKFWDEQGSKYLHIESFGKTIKGQTLEQIYNKHFSGMDDIQMQITGDLNEYEENMSYEYLPGVVDFLKELHANGAGIALVTSSNLKKMANVYKIHPEMPELFDEILTAERFTKSKPDPECFLLGMKLLGALPENSFVFEDSFHGLQAGRSSGATVIGLATTNSREAIQGSCNWVIDDFVNMTYDRLILKS
ncbi:HAD family phosphatase [Bacteroides sp. 224]|uniref:HAD family hydrolase n=1 Tax=Bacteroides sp. 224 TaxID=2302936 RepID=UPI0013D0B836|nr:HAD family phosphatase [Bacteroides sp. 224]NDV66896.1 HAD family phosphatase [Bacteroides sp. 224]